MSESNDFSRREFMRKTASVGAAVPYFVSAGALGKGDGPEANEKINIGLIGCGGMGKANLNNCAKYPDVVVTGVCDPWKERRDSALQKYQNTAKSYNDYRQMLQQKDIDAVIIATPPHWHALIAIDACEAGKDIYVQKPMTLYPAEALALKQAVEKHKRISQIGTQIHAGSNYRRVVELIRSGNLGKISVARTFIAMNDGVEGWGKPADCNPPEGLDWDLWVGPARMRQFNPRMISRHVVFMDFGGGWTPSMGPHVVDLPYWALELDLPTKVSCSGGRYAVDDVSDIPDTQEVLWQYPEFTMTWCMSTVNSFGFDFGRGNIARRIGAYFHGVNGTLFADYDMHKVVPEGDRMKNAQTPKESIPPSPGHEREWLNCIKTRRQPSCSVFYHYKIDIALNLANLSLKLRRSIDFDPKTAKIINGDEAAKAAVPQYRDPWKFPAQYL